METKLLTTAEAADRLGISEVRIRQLCQDGRLGRKIGRDWLFTAEEVESFRRQSRPTGRPAKD
jgi:excisionase family DNA binding protein